MGKECLQEMLVLLGGAFFNGEDACQPYERAPHMGCEFM